MAIIAITGQPCSGKTFCLRTLRRLGAQVFDADSLVHKYYRGGNAEVIRKIARIFPSCLVNGKIERRILGKIVFADSSKLKVLERIVHPIVIEELFNWFKKNRLKKGLFFAEVPLLYEKRLESKFDAVIVVKISQEKIISRLKVNRGFDKKLAQQCLSHFLPLKRKIRKADYVINNNAGLEKLEGTIKELFKKIKTEFNIN